MASEEIPDFDIDPELEEQLTTNLDEMDEDTRQEVQLYKSRKLQAKRDADMESDQPGWWGDNPAPETVEQTGAEGVSREVPDVEETEEESTTEESDGSEETVETSSEESEEESQEVAEESSQADKQETKDEEETDDSAGTEEDSDESGEEDEEENTDEQTIPDKEAPPPTDTDRYKGERKIGELVDSRSGGREVTRRGFISSFGLGMAGVMAGFAAGGVGTARFFFPNVLSNPPEQFVAGEPNDYSSGSVSSKFKNQYRVWIVNLSDRLVAIEAICTHLGCTPNWISSQGVFKCPCHGSAYYMNGVNFAGPAPRPMKRVAVRLNPQGKIVVDKSKSFTSNASPGWNADDAYIAV